MKAMSRPAPSQRGSLLIVAMIITAVIGISLASYIRLGVQSQKVSNRALYNNAAINLAENGLEEAMYAINKLVADETYAWPGWTNDGTAADSDAWRRFPSSSGTYTYDQNTTGYVRVYVYNYKGVNSPVIVARSTVTLGGTTAAPIEKWIEVALRRTSKFANGLVAKDTILFQGNTASVNSWNSDPDNNDATAAIPYSNSVKNDNGSVGSISVSSDAVSVQNADIWGYASTGGSLPQVGPNGLVGSYGPPATKAGVMDMSRVSTDFSADFDPVAMPALTTSIGGISATTSLGTAGTATTVTCTAISLAGSDQLNIVGDVTLLITASAGFDAISIAGNAGINIAAGSSLVIYTEGDIDIGGNGVANGGTTTTSANQPKNFQIWGTSTSTSSDQNISIKGNGVLSGVVYAPNGSVSIVGNGDVMGSVVAEDITVTGSAAFHYDESLGNFGGENPFRVSSWKELTTESQRSAYSSLWSLTY